MNKNKFIGMVSDKSGLTRKDADLAFRAVMDSLVAVLVNGDSMMLPGFASISVKRCAARKGRNPATGKEILIPEKNGISIKISTKLKEAINRHNYK